MSRRPRKSAPPAAAAPRDGGDAGAARPRRAGDWPALLLLAAAAFFAYQKAWHAGFVWDDDAHVIRPALASLGGLRRIWCEPGATQQYYPVLCSAFWLELRLWGYSALGYHLANVALHAAAACLLYRVLRRLAVPGALLGASAFALHPVCVESVAWISEEKNTLSAVFYLAAALAYLRFDEGRRWRWYAAATLLFTLALLSKTVTATLPAALLVVAWWRRGRLSWRGDAAALSPWLAMGAAAGLATAWMERAFVGAAGPSFALGPIERLLVAGRALWFYLGKLLWPADLVFIYPRWSPDARSLWQDLLPAAAAAALAALYALRRRSRGPLAAALLFAGTLFPALGFVDVYPFRFSFVADHFQYLAAAMVLPAIAAAVALAASGLPPAMRSVAWAAAACAVAALGVQAWRQCAIYADVGTLWQATIARNPDCWMAYNNLGLALAADGQADAAIGQYRRALEIYPGFAAARNNLGLALMKLGRADEAIAQYRMALEAGPGDAETHNNLGIALRREGRLDEAVAEYAMALAIKPDDPGTNYNMGNALLQLGRVDEAVARLGRAVDLSPGFADARVSLGNALRRAGRLDEAVAQFERALAIDPSSARARDALEAALSSRSP